MTDEAQIPEFCIVIVPTDDHARVEYATGVDAMVEIVRGQVDQEVQVFVFEGTHIPMTIPPQRYLVRGGNLIPLFNPVDPETLPIDPFGAMGDLEIVLPDEPKSSSSSYEWVDDSSSSSRSSASSSSEGLWYESSASVDD